MKAADPVIAHADFLRAVDRLLKNAEEVRRKREALFPVADEADASNGRAGTKQ